jgi:hypothetical protein
MCVCVSLWVILVWTEKVRDEIERGHLMCHLKVFVNVLCGPFKSSYIIRMEEEEAVMIETKRWVLMCAVRCTRLYARDATCQYGE